MVHKKGTLEFFKYEKNDFESYSKRWTYGILKFILQNYVKEPLDNCELELFPSFAYRYGWLEQFRAFTGELIAV